MEQAVNLALSHASLSVYCSVFLNEHVEHLCVPISKVDPITSHNITVYIPDASKINKVADFLTNCANLIDEDIVTSITAFPVALHLICNQLYKASYCLRNILVKNRNQIPYSQDLTLFLAIIRRIRRQGRLIRTRAQQWRALRRDH